MSLFQSPKNPLLDKGDTVSTDDTYACRLRMARRNLEKIEQGDLGAAVMLWKIIYGSSILLADIPITRERLVALLKELGEYALTEAKKDRFHTLSSLWLLESAYARDATHPRITWKDFGTSEAVVRDLVVTSARRYYAEMMQGKPEFAPLILGLPFYEDYDWDELLEVCAAHNLMDSFVQWAKAEFELLQDLSLQPDEAFVRCEFLLTQLNLRHLIAEEVARNGKPSLNILEKFPSDFTVQVMAMEAAWYQKSRKKEEWLQ